MKTAKVRGFEVAVHSPGIAVVTFNQPERLNGTTSHVGLKAFAGRRPPRVNQALRPGR